MKSIKILFAVILAMFSSEFIQAQGKWFPAGAGTAVPIFISL